MWYDASAKLGFSDKLLVSPANYILFEEPFGRARFEISKLVDFSVHLDLPADIALARAVLRQKENGGDPIAFVERHLRDGLSDFFRMQGKREKSQLISYWMRPYRNAN